MRNTVKTRAVMPVFLIVVSLILSVGLSACTSSSPKATDNQPDASQPEIVEGPHADSNRNVEKTIFESSSDGKSYIITVDFGNYQFGQYSTPVRGILVTPKNVGKKEPTPLIVINHLRYPNCSDGTNAYPCPKGSKEVRLDQGMAWFGEKLAAQGYSSLIPDLGGIWVGADQEEPYSQPKMWDGVIKTMLTKLRRDNAGESENFAVNLKNKIDLNKIGLFVHSRGGTLIWQAEKTFGENKLKSILAYGPSYVTDDPATFSPPPPNVPYLAITGDIDGDVGESANLWLSQHVSENRTSPALSVQIPGYGHTYINQKLQEPNFDDRKACDLTQCKNEKEHEALLETAAKQWFDATIKNRQTELPLNSFDPLPPKIAGVSARWLAVSNTNNARVNHLPAEKFVATENGTAALCQIVDPMDPGAAKTAQACPHPEVGVVSSVSKINVLTSAKAETSIRGAKLLALHLTPFGGTKNRTTKPVKIVLSFKNGKKWETEIDQNNPILADLKTEYDNGQYSVGTIRLPLPEQVTDNEITQITLETDNRPVALRGVDFNWSKQVIALNGENLEQ